MMNVMTVAGGMSWQDDWNTIMSREYCHYCDHWMDEHFLKKISYEIIIMSCGKSTSSPVPFLRTVTKQCKGLS